MDIKNENWKIYRKNDKYLPEYIIDQNDEIVCFLNERKYFDTAYEREEIEMIEFRSKLISLAPDLFNVLNGLVYDIIKLLSDEGIECQQSGYFELAKLLIEKLNKK